MQVDGSLKFNSGSMNLGNRYYHHQRYYTNLQEPSRTALQMEQDLLQKYLQAWKKEDQPCSGWVFDLRVHQQQSLSKGTMVVAEQ